MGVASGHRMFLQVVAEQRSCVLSGKLVPAETGCKPVPQIVQAQIDNSGLLAGFLGPFPRTLTYLTEGARCFGYEYRGIVVDAQDGLLALPGLDPSRRRMS